MRTKDYIKCLYIIPYIFLGNFMDIISTYKFTGDIYQRFLQDLFQGSYHLEKVNIFVSITGIGYIVIHNILFGSIIYKDTYDSAEYIFTRYDGRLKWYVKKVFRIIETSILCNLLYVGLRFLIIIKNAASPITKIDINIFISVFIIMTLFTIFSTLLVNVMALFFGSNIALIGLYVMEGFSTIIALLHSADDISTTFLWLNPMSNILISWNYSNVQSFIPSIYFIITIAIIAFVGYKKVVNMDILLKKNDD